MTNNQEREARCAEAIESVLHGDRREQEAVARAVVAVADAEQAELRDELEEETVARQAAEYALHQRTAQWEAAEAELAALRGRIEALARAWLGLARFLAGAAEHQAASHVRDCVDDLRALTASPAEDTTPAAPHAEDGA